MTNVKYFTELNKLFGYLNEHGYHAEMRDLWDGYQVRTYNEAGDLLWDAVCHSGSYGSSKGLLETMGLDMYNDPDDEYDGVVGWLTADDIIKALEA